MVSSVTAFAPASVANVAVGFDFLGFAFDLVGDEVSLARESALGIRLEKIDGLGGAKIPLDPMKNTAAVALESLLRAHPLPFGFRMSLKKGIPLSSGMGGSAASAVAAVVAVNAFFDQPLAKSELLKHALAGEFVASGAAHPDNAAASLFGGLTAALRDPRGISDAIEVVALPVPAGVRCVLVHPHVELETRRSRAALSSEIKLTDHVRQSSALAGFLVACQSGDLNLLRRSFVDVVVEPQRERLIPGFAAAKAAALECGALGASISGSGPSVFAWAASEDEASRIRNIIRDAFKRVGIEADAWTATLGCSGARVVRSS